MYKFDPENIQLGISSCVLGQEVRFDGGHRRSAFCTDQLADYVKFVPLCPEMAIGLGKPRPSIRLQRNGTDVSAVTSKGDDVTAALREFGQQAARQHNFLSGYILCGKSPSCGMERVRVYDAVGRCNVKEGVGLFAAELMKANPLLPLEENGRLNDLTLRENFITRVYAYHDWLSLLHKGLTARALIDFHSRYKFLLLAHNPKVYYELGPLLAKLSEDFEHKADTYIHAFMGALKQVATRKRQCNVLQHIQGFFKDKLSSSQRQELARVIENYRQGLVPLLAPLTLINHFLNEYPNEYIRRQRYLNPYPETLALRYAI